MSEIHAVSRQRHGRLHWTRFTNYAFAAQDTVVPLVAHELPRAHMSHPVLFIANDVGFTPVAVVGVRAGRNLHVDGAGRWSASYIPAHYRGYPFQVVRREQGDYVLCVDEGSGLVNENGEGEPFYGDDGGASKSLAEVLTFLKSVQTNREHTTRACAVINALGLLQSSNFTGRTDEGGSGLFQIDGDAFKKLSAESLARLRDAGALEIIYAHWFSMQHLPALMSLAERESQEQQASPRQTIEGQDFLDMNDGDSFDFESLLQRVGKPDAE